MIEIILIIVLIVMLGLTAWYIMGMANNMIVLNNKLDELYKMAMAENRKKKRTSKAKPIGFEIIAADTVISKKRNIKPKPNT